MQEDVSEHESDLDLERSVGAIGRYVDDREEMLEQMFRNISRAKLKAMLPEILKVLTHLPLPPSSWNVFGTWKDFLNNIFSPYHWTSLRGCASKKRKWCHENEFSGSLTVRFMLWLQFLTLASDPFSYDPLLPRISNISSWTDWFGVFHSLQFVWLVFKRHTIITKRNESFVSSVHKCPCPFYHGVAALCFFTMFTLHKFM